MKVELVEESLGREDSEWERGDDEINEDKPAILRRILIAETEGKEEL